VALTVWQSNNGSATIVAGDHEDIRVSRVVEANAQWLIQLE
jgi:hypothetical protein